MTFNGQAPSQEKVTEFFSLLENSYYLREVMMKYSERAKDFAPPLYVFEFSTSIEDSQKKGVAR